MLKYTHEHIQLVLTIDQTNMGATKLVIRTCVECIVCDDCDIVRQGLFDGMAKQITWIVVLPFVLNLVFNFAFTPLQFGLRNNLLAAIDILLCARNTYLGNNCNISPYEMDCVHTDSIFALGIICYSVAIHGNFLNR